MKSTQKQLIAVVGATFSWFQAHMYLGKDAGDEIALANKVAGRRPTPFATWARENFALQAA